MVDGYNVTINEDGSVTAGDENDNPPVTTGKTDGSFDNTEGVNTPKLSSNMQLVVYNNGEWVEDTTKSAYKYEAQAGATEEGGTSEWANAKVTKEGVESYFVWIPRYAYKIDSTNQTLDVKFIQGTGTIAADGVTECKYANDPTLNTQTDYIIHPAFTTDIENGGWTEELSGIWVGKYETSRSDAEGTNAGTSTTIKIQPNVTSWRRTKIGDMYYYAKAYATELKSHMLKNSEWGAVAYLTHSKYGRNGTEIAINNSNNYITGTSGGSTNASLSDETYEYNDMINGILASSTGNVYGIYDLSGGAYEYVASYYSGSTSDNLINNGSQLTDEANRKYVTAYDGINLDRNYKQGDATKETKGWNGDFANFVDSDHPFFLRGGVYSNTSNAGVFYFSYSGGDSSSSNGSFRICLAVE